MAGLISFNRFGSYGRLGNMMFQYSTVLGVSKMLGMLPVVNLSQDPFFKKAFNLSRVGDTVLYNCEIGYSEQSFSFQKEIFELDSRKNTNIDGYFQSSKYFNHCKNDILDEFTFSKDIRIEAAKKIPEDVCVSVHIRRGDYTKVSHVHTNLDEQWYRTAISKFEGYIPVFFSDDIEWVKKTFSDIQGAVFIENENDINLDPNLSSDQSAYIDMCAMSFCNAHIMANSSFSWWASYLSGARTIAPKQWFGSSGPKNWSDVYCENWEVL